MELKALGVRVFSLDLLPSSAARANWRQTALLLISSSDAIREAADLSQLSLYIGDSYEVSKRSAMLTIPWNVGPEDLPRKMKSLLAAGGGMLENPAAGNGAEVVRRSDMASTIHSAGEASTYQEGVQQGPGAYFSASSAVIAPLPPLTPNRSNEADAGVGDRRGGGGGHSWESIFRAAAAAAIPVIAATLGFIVRRRGGPK